MEKEFKTLSKEIIYCYGINRLDVLKVEKVKEFIEWLKEIDYGEFIADGIFIEEMLFEKIDKLCGEKLK